MFNQVKADPHGPITRKPQPNFFFLSDEEKTSFEIYLVGPLSAMRAVKIATTV